MNKRILSLALILCLLLQLLVPYITIQAQGVPMDPYYALIRCHVANADAGLDADMNPCEVADVYLPVMLIEGTIMADVSMLSSLVGFRYEQNGHSLCLYTGSGVRYLYLTEDSAAYYLEIGTHTVSGSVHMSPVVNDDGFWIPMHDTLTLLGITNIGVVSYPDVFYFITSPQDDLIDVLCPLIQDDIYSLSYDPLREADIDPAEMQKLNFGSGTVTVLDGTITWDAQTLAAIAKGMIPFVNDQAAFETWEREVIQDVTDLLVGIGSDELIEYSNQAMQSIYDAASFASEWSQSDMTHSAADLVSTAVRRQALREVSGIAMSNSFKAEMTDMIDRAGTYTAEAQSWEDTTTAFGAITFGVTQVISLGYTYAKYAHRDEFATEAIKQVLDSPAASSLSENYRAAMSAQIAEYSSIHKVAFTEYIRKNLFEYVEFMSTSIAPMAGLSAAPLFAAAFAAKAAYGILGVVYPPLSEGADRAASFQQYLYAQYYQDAAQAALRDAVADVNFFELNNAELQKIVQLGYAYYKACYVTRALASSALNVSLEYNPRVADTIEIMSKLAVFYDDLERMNNPVTVSLQASNIDNDNELINYLIPLRVTFIGTVYDTPSTRNIVSDAEIQSYDMYGRFIDTFYDESNGTFRFTVPIPLPAAPISGDTNLAEHFHVRNCFTSATYEGEADEVVKNLVNYYYSLTPSDGVVRDMSEVYLKNDEPDIYIANSMMEYKGVVYHLKDTDLPGIQRIDIPIPQNMEYIASFTIYKDRIYFCAANRGEFSESPSGLYSCNLDGSDLRIHLSYEGSGGMNTNISYYNFSIWDDKLFFTRDGNRYIDLLTFEDVTIPDPDPRMVLIQSGRYTSVIIGDTLYYTDMSPNAPYSPDCLYAQVGDTTELLYRSDGGRFIQVEAITASSVYFCLSASEGFRLYELDLETHELHLLDTRAYMGGDSILHW